MKSTHDSHGSCEKDNDYVDVVCEQVREGGREGGRSGGRGKKAENLALFGREYHACTRGEDGWFRCMCL